MWAHTFVCLAKTEQVEIPNYKDKVELKLAGLGEKRCSVDVYADLHEQLLTEFPKLDHSGVFELLRQGSCSKTMDLIPTHKVGIQ